MTPYVAVIARSAATKQSRLAALLLLSLAGCAPSGRSPHLGCLLPGQQPMVVAELFFGRAAVSDGDWAEFAAQTVAPNFPDGFTAWNGEGQWRNPMTGVITGAPTKILLVAAPRTPDLPARLSAVIEAYKTRFRQQSVGLITREACASF
jgi:hypothetical protein